MTAVARSTLEQEGDASVYEGDLANAKSRYGVAIDEALRQRDYSAALRISEKLIRVAPDVVRARATRAFLVVGLDPARAVLAVGQYAMVLERQSHRQYAVRTMLLLSRATDNRAVHEIIIASLRRMGAHQEARLVASTVVPPFDAERWEMLLALALLDSA